MSNNISDAMPITLSNDFAARVLNHADALIRRRRKKARVLAGSVAAGLILTAVLSVHWLTVNVPPRTIDATRPVEVPAIAWIVVPSGPNGADAVRYFFPNAGRVARLATTYHALSYGDWTATPSTTSVYWNGVTPLARVQVRAQYMNPVDLPQLARPN